MPGANITALTNSRTAEISLVKSPANRKPFATTKSENPMPIKDTLVAVLNTPAEGEEQFVASLKSAGADDARLEAAVANYRLQRGYADVVKAEDMDLVAKAAYGKKSKKKGNPFGKDDDDDDDDDEDVKKSKKSAVELTLKAAEVAALPDGIRASIELMMKSNQMLADQVKSLSGTVQELADSRDSAVLTAKAQTEFAHIPGMSHEQVGAMMKSASKAGVGDDMIKMLKTINEVSKSSGIFRMAGSAGGGNGGGASAQAKVEALAESLTLKSADGTPMSKAQKIQHVLEHTSEGKALYHDYLTENPAQRARYGF